MRNGANIWPVNVKNMSRKSRKSDMREATGDRGTARTEHLIRNNYLRRAERPRVVTLVLAGALAVLRETRLG